MMVARVQLYCAMSPVCVWVAWGTDKLACMQAGRQVIISYLEDQIRFQVRAKVSKDAFHLAKPHSFAVMLIQEAWLGQEPAANLQRHRAKDS